LEILLGGTAWLDCYTVTIICEHMV